MPRNLFTIVTDGSCPRPQGPGGFAAICIEDESLTTVGYELETTNNRMEMRALFEPRPERGGVLQHAVLDVNLVLLVAREGGIEAGQEPVAAIGGQLVREQEVGVAPRITEKRASCGRWRRSRGAPAKRRGTARSRCRGRS